MRTLSTQPIRLSKSIQNRRPSRNRISPIYKLRQYNVKRHAISHDMVVLVNICTAKDINPIAHKIIHPHKPDLERTTKHLLRFHPVHIENKILAAIPASRPNQVHPDIIRKFTSHSHKNIINCQPFRTNRQPIYAHREQK